jgi:hypothetical protein
MMTAATIETFIDKYNASVDAASHMTYSASLLVD